MLGDADEMADVQHLIELAAWLREHRWGHTKADAVDRVRSRLAAAERRYQVAEGDADRLARRGQAVASRHYDDWRKWENNPPRSVGRMIYRAMIEWEKALALHDAALVQRAATDNQEGLRFCRTCDGSGLVPQTPGQPGDGYTACPTCSQDTP